MVANIEPRNYLFYSFEFELTPFSFVVKKHFYLVELEFWPRILSLIPAMVT